MELFTMGVGNYTEADVYAAARVFSGWNRRGPAPRRMVRSTTNSPTSRTSRRRRQDVQLCDLSRRRKTIPRARRPAGCRTASTSSTAWPRTRTPARYLAAKLYRFFVTDFGAVNVTFVKRVASVYLQSSGDMKAVMREVLLSPEFWDESAYFARYSWPSSSSSRALKDIGWTGFSVNDALTPLSNMGQILYEPPDVAAGTRASVVFDRRDARADELRVDAGVQPEVQAGAAVKAANASRTPDALLSYFSDALVTRAARRGVTTEWSNYLRATGAWTGSDAQLEAKSSGLVHLIAGSPEYQLV
jgi:uncharacterized protein (DUF1800 family)